jgi:hypothetical protein
MKLKQILNEYVNVNISSLEKYLNSSDDDRAMDLINLIDSDIASGKTVIGIAIENADVYPFKYDYSKIRDEVEEKTFDYVQSKYTDFAREIKKYIIELDIKPRRENLMMYTTSYLFDYIQPKYRPTWVYYKTPVRLIKNTWLIHSTKKENVIDILKNGFTRGVSDMKILGLTTKFGDSEKNSGGYIFAHTIDDFVDYGTRPSFNNSDVVKTKYGDGYNFIIFRSSGLLAYHKNDAEYQVILDGKTARDFVAVKYVESKWRIVNPKTGKFIFSSSDIHSIPLWVKKNYDQYRKVF